MVAIEDYAKVSEIVDLELKTPRDLTTHSQSGIPRSSLDAFTHHAGVTVAEFSELAGFEEAKLFLKKKKLTPQASEKLLEMAMLFVRGIEVFGEVTAFKEWLNKDNIALGDISPKELLKTSFGIQEVSDELGRIEHGIFA